jgi:hypothetical protein
VALAAPGGAVLWYDFTVDNPRNRDVRGVPLSRLRALFPAASRLAPGGSPWRRRWRVVCRVHPALYGAFNTVPWLRTHVLAWVEKPR